MKLAFILILFPLLVFLSACISKNSICEDPSHPADQGENKAKPIRLLPLKGADNCRDLGGYQTADGHHVKWGIIYRSGNLHDLSRSDKKYLLNAGIIRVVDFRGPTEMKKEKDRLPKGISYMHYPINIAGEDMRGEIKAVVLGKSEMNINDYLVNANRQLVHDYADVYEIWLKELIANPLALPQIFHCTAGKDRAGFAAALLLGILGVPDETIMQDYMKTNEYKEKYIEKTIRMVNILTVSKDRGEMIRPMLSAETRYLKTAFEAIHTHWGSWENYAIEKLEMTPQDIETLKEMFLE